MQTHHSLVKATAFFWRRLAESATSLPFIVAILVAGCGGGGAGGTAAAPAVTGGVTAAQVLWSNPATWGGTKPVAGVTVLIPTGMKVELDEQTVELAELIVEGELSFKPGVTSELRAGLVRVRAGGSLLAGSAAQPFRGRATVTLSGTDTLTADPMGTRGILVSAGGRVRFFGSSPARPWTRLNANAAMGATSLVLAEAVDWQAGDQIVVAPTDWYPSDPVLAAQATERRTLTAVAGNTLTMSAGLGRFKWGRMQYVTDTGMSLVPGTFTKPHPDAVDTLDERAEVGNLSRNIVIQGADDALWQASGFGAHIMVMDLNSSLQLEGVELRRVGQAGKVGRYPIHWHLLSYAANGTALGDAAGHFVRNSTVWDSRHRCIVVHGTNGVSIQNNICYDIKGHAIFLEDAVERRNVIEGNLVLKVRSPSNALATVVHEKPTTCGASSGYWLTNPDNTVRNNAAADAEGNGIWLSYSVNPVKQNVNVPIRPHNLQHGVFEFNSSHSNRMNGLQLECGMIDDAGNLQLLFYSPTTDGLPDVVSNRARFTFKGITTFKNRNGYLNRAINPDYLQWANADNSGRGFTGAVQLGSTLKQSLVVGRSLNDGLPYPAGAEPQLGVASYHSTLDITQNTFVGLTSEVPTDVNLPSGVFGTDDYYLRPLEKGFWRNPDNKLINAAPGYRVPPPHLQAGYTPASNLSWTYAGAIWDPHGYWTTAGRWWVFDNPFLIQPGLCTPLQVSGGQPNGLSCPGPYFGVTQFNLNRALLNDTLFLPGGFTEKIVVERLDGTPADTVLGTWAVEQGFTSVKLGNMRHFTGVQGGTYRLRFPAFPNASVVKEAPRRVSLVVQNLIDGTDTMMLGVHFDGATVPVNVFVSTDPSFPNPTNSRTLITAASRAAVAAGPGNLYWQDTANNLVWVKLTPLGLPGAFPGIVAGSDEDLFRQYTLRVE